jgi:hypothetical protein
MRRFLTQVMGLLLLAALALPARAQSPTPPFPVSSIQAKQAVSSTLQSIGSNALAALDSPATLKKLLAELNKRYTEVPGLEDVKALVLRTLGPGAIPQFDLIDPDNAPLLQTTFARQSAIREPNPDLGRVQEATWPPALTHGERVALQSYSGSAFGVINQSLRAGGKVPPLYARVHARLKSAFEKAPPFDPPVDVSRGAQIGDPKQLQALVSALQTAKKKGEPYVMLGYGSSTVGPKVLPGWDKGNVQMHIKATHGIDVYPVSLYPNEKEFLLPHRSTYRVTSITQQGSQWIVHLEQIPPKAGGKAPAKPKAESPAPGK